MRGSVEKLDLSRTRINNMRLNELIKMVIFFSYATTVVLEKTLENPLDSKEVKPVDPKGNQS